MVLHFLSFLDYQLHPLTSLFSIGNLFDLFVVSGSASGLYLVSGFCSLARASEFEIWVA